MGNRSDVARDALVKAGARQLWAGAIPGVGSVAMYEDAGRTVILQTVVSPTGTELGWELFVPASSSNRTDATIEAAVRWLHEGTLPGTPASEELVDLAREDLDHATGDLLDKVKEVVNEADDAALDGDSGLAVSVSRLRRALVAYKAEAEEFRVISVREGCA